ncbi:MAG: hypothetical protein H7A43_03075 [Verrucomicrobia bacterium]|nr:hypothetical protein [Verrucomicrobiota bacterium]
MKTIIIMLALIILALLAASVSTSLYTSARIEAHAALLTSLLPEDVPSREAREKYSEYIDRVVNNARVARKVSLACGVSCAVLVVLASIIRRDGRAES